MANAHHYIFVDESGDPGKPYKVDASGEKVATGASQYYILTALCVDSKQLFTLENKIIEVKHKFGFYGEIKSNQISLPLHSALLSIINDLNMKTFYRLIDKTKYKGVFAVDGNKKLHNVFDEYNLVKLVSSSIKSQNLINVEVVIDRAERRLLDGKFDNFNKYLLSKVNTKTIKRIGYITHVDSEYVNVMQMSDLVSGALKDYVTGKNIDLKGVLKEDLLIEVI